jgi:cytochrome c biogenesis protein CcdA
MGTELLATGSVLAAFFAGGVALFAPCCIVFLAPSYLAGAAKNRRWRLLPLTFIFAAGLAVVLVPLTMGASLVAGAVAKYHGPLYIAGGLLMFAMAYLTLSGKMWSLPSIVRMPDTSRGDSASFFALGVFSGIASSCCAPVLVGVMTLSALSGSAGGGVLLGLAYVFGMVFPLFAMALLWDKTRLSRLRVGRSRVVTLTVGGRILRSTIVNLVIAASFVVMGAAIIALSQSANMTGGSAIQDWISVHLVLVFSRVEQWLSPIPEPILGLALFAVVLGIVTAAVTDRRRSRLRIDQESNERIDAR